MDYDKITAYIFMYAIAMQISSLKKKLIITLRDIEKFLNLSVISLILKILSVRTLKYIIVHRNRKQFKLMSVRTKFCQSKPYDWHFSRTLQFVSASNFYFTIASDTALTH